MKGKDMFEKPVIDLPRTAPCEEPVNNEISESEISYDTFEDEVLDPNDSIPEIEMPFQGVRGPAVRAPIYGKPESRPERTLPRAAREQIAASRPAPSNDLGDDPFAQLMTKFGR